MMYPLVSELAVDGVPVTVTCRVLKLVRQDYYRWLAAPVTASELEEAYLANALFDAHRDDPEFGYRFLADEVHDAGFSGLRAHGVEDLLAKRLVVVSFGKKKTRKKTAKVHTPAHDDLVKRQFTAVPPTTSGWATSPSTRRRKGSSTSAPSRTPVSNRIVGYSIDERMKARLAVAAINNAVARRGDVAGCIFHTDRGSQFRSRKVHRALTRHRMVGSMGQVGSAGDNAAMESFFALLQKNVLNTKRWDTREELRIAIVTWIERTYHRRRRQVALGRLTPVEYEAIMTPLITEAA